MRQVKVRAALVGDVVATGRCQLDLVQAHRQHLAAHERTVTLEEREQPREVLVTGVPHIRVDEGVAEIGATEVRMVVAVAWLMV